MYNVDKPGNKNKNKILSYILFVCLFKFTQVWFLQVKS